MMFSLTHWRQNRHVSRGASRTDRGVNPIEENIKTMFHVEHGQKENTFNVPRGTWRLKCLRNTM